MYNICGLAVCAGELFPELVSFFMSGRTTHRSCDEVEKIGIWNFAGYTRNFTTRFIFAGTASFI